MVKKKGKGEIHLNDIEIAILNYENQLVANRKQLNDLIYAYHSGKIDSALLNDKINYLQTEIKYMDNQLNILKSSFQNSMQNGMPQALGNTPEMQNEMPQAPGSIPAVQNGMPQVPGNTPEMQNGMPQAQRNIPPMQNAMPKPQQNMAMQPSGKKKDLENVIGKSWMGIFASVLIFISFILFATVLAPFLTDNIKMAAMYIVSIAFTAFGLVKLKAQKNKTYLAISSCGVGAIYISLLLSNLYFKAISEIVLYVLLLIWAVFVCYLAKFQDVVFEIIGQCGIAISLVFGIMFCTDTQDTMMAFLLCLFFVSTATIFYISNLHKEFHKNIINHIFNAVNVALLWLELFEEMDGGGYLTFARIVVLIFLLVQLLFFFRSRLEEKNVGFGIFTSINGLMVLFLLSDLIPSSNVCAILWIVMGAILLVVTEKKCTNKEDGGRIILQIFCMILFVLSIASIPFFKEHISISIVMIIMAVLGYYRNDKIYKYGSFVILCIYLCLHLNPVEYLCLGAIYFGLIAYAVFVKKEQYDMLFKLLSYVACVIFAGKALGDLCSGLEEDISITIVFFAVSVLNLVAMKSRFTKNLATMQEEKQSLVVTRIIHGMCMLYVLSAITEVQNEVCHCILILLAIVLFVANSKNLIATQKGLPAGIYIGIKLTVLVVTVLHSFEAANYVISISAFLFAIASIVVGFKFNIKAFRIYGLILSMLSVIKLIMIDISYENTLGHALSFFISGMLCFVISMIYNVIDKRLHRDEQE